MYGIIIPLCCRLSGVECQPAAMLEPAWDAYLGRNSSHSTMRHRDNEVRLAKDVWRVRRGTRHPTEEWSEEPISDYFRFRRGRDEGRKVSVNSYRAMETRKTFLGCGGPHLNCIYCAFTAPQSLGERTAGGHLTVKQKQ